VGGHVKVITVPIKEVADKVVKDKATTGDRNPEDINEEVTEEVVKDEAKEMVDALADGADE